MRAVFWILPLASLLAGQTDAARQAAAEAPIQIHVDATDAPRRIFHVKMTLPASPGPMTLLYPQWIPGEHGPTGPVVNLVNLKIEADGHAIPWKRDSVNMFAFAIDVPAGDPALDVAFDYISPPESGGFTSGSSTTSELAVLNWNQLLLYPKGADADSIQFQASLKVPSGWRYGTALPIQRETGNDIEFKPASLTTLVDSPLSAGAHYRTIDLGADSGPDSDGASGIPHYLHIAADSDRALEIRPEVIDEYKNLVKETGALFGSRHYRRYDFLLTLSDHVAHFGLEHHESSDDRNDERTLIDPEIQRVEATLLPHEFTHSWNGKYRRPIGLTNGGKDGGYDTPMKGDLLWVYEGLTEYLGEILTQRSGLRTAGDFHESLAATAADLDNKFGRTWRPLEDTAITAQLLYSAGEDYDNIRRNVDYYPEGILIWLDADTTIRQLSHGAKSLDDFCRAFYGGPGGAPALKPYTFEDLVAALNAIQPYDWALFFNSRVNSTDAHAPLGGIEHGGWKLTYDAVRSDFWRALEAEHKWTDLSYSIGFKVYEDGSIADVQYGGPAQKAGIAPSTKLIAVNNRQFTPSVLRDAIARSAKDSKPIELLIKTGDYYEVHRVEYYGGERYPHLIRDSSAPDLLSQITAPHAK
jgi:predicted metalloprotease with PDZ domain